MARHGGGGDRQRGCCAWGPRRVGRGGWSAAAVGVPGLLNSTPKLQYSRRRGLGDAPLSIGLCTLRWAMYTMQEHGRLGRRPSLLPARPSFRPAPAPCTLHAFAGLTAESPSRRPVPPPRLPSEKVDGGVPAIGGPGSATTSAHMPRTRSPTAPVQAKTRLAPPPLNSVAAKCDAMR